jgi:hypothetical protein
MHALGPDRLHGYVRRLIGDHSPNRIGVPRHDMGALADTNDPWRVSVAKAALGQTSCELKDLDASDDGYPPQLFDMIEDPSEQQGLSADPRFAAIRDALVARILADWDPREIEARMAAPRPRHGSDRRLGKSGAAAEPAPVGWQRCDLAPKR